MYRWSKIPEEHRPEIISDISDDKFLTFVVQDWDYKKILRKDATTTAAAVAAAVARTAAVAADDGADDAIYATDVAWEGYYWHNSGSFKNIIDKNIPCVLMHKVKNVWAPEIDTIICFMTGECNDVFLVHPKDLTEWDPNDV